jgi:hypothetical protein
MKKGDMSIQMIVIVVIALLILIIIAVLIYNSNNNLRNAGSCIEKGGVCVLNTDSCDRPIYEGTCVDAGKSCCAIA